MVFFRCHKLKLAYFLEDRYLSSEDSLFVDLVVADLEQFSTQAAYNVVLLFPPVNNYLRLLIHKTVEDFDELHSFSVGEGIQRQTVVCWTRSLIQRDQTRDLTFYPRPQEMRGRGRGRLKDRNSPSPGPGDRQGSGDGMDRWNHDRNRSESGATGRSTTVQQAHESPCEENVRNSPVNTPTGGIQGRTSSPATTESGNSNRTRKSERSKNRRPDVQVYVPRARRPPASGTGSSGTVSETPSSQHTPESASRTRPKYTDQPVEDISESTPSPEVTQTSVPVRQKKQEMERYVPRGRQLQVESNRNTTQPSASPGDEGMNASSTETPTNIHKKVKVCEDFPMTSEEVLKSGFDNQQEHRESGNSIVSAQPNPVMENEPNLVLENKQNLVEENTVTDCSDECQKYMNKCETTIEEQTTNDLKHPSSASTTQCNTLENISTVSDLDLGPPNAANSADIAVPDFEESVSQTAYQDRDINKQSIEVDERAKDELQRDTETDNDKMIVPTDINSLSSSVHHSYDIKNDETSKHECEVEDKIKNTPSNTITLNKKLDVCDINEKDHTEMNITEDNMNPVDSSETNTNVTRPDGISQSYILESIQRTNDSNETDDNEKKLSENILVDTVCNTAVDNESARDFSEANHSNESARDFSEANHSNESARDFSEANHSNESAINEDIVDDNCSELKGMDVHLSESMDTTETCVNDVDWKSDNTDGAVDELVTHLDAKSASKDKKIKTKKNRKVKNKNQSKHSDAQNDQSENSLAKQNEHQSESDINSSQSKEEEVDEDSWDTMFDDDGECLDPTAMEELTKTVGQVKIQKSTKINYLNYQPKDKSNFDFSQYEHIIEIYDFPAEFVTRDLIIAFQSFMSRGFDLKWVDDTHALGIFSSAIAANDALQLPNPLLKVCPLSQASKQSQMKAKRCTEFLQPYKARPETSAMAARRLVAGALGLATGVSKEKREKERQQLKEAKAKKRQERQNRENIWEYGKCAMDE